MDEMIFQRRTEETTLRGRQSLAFSREDNNTRPGKKLFVAPGITLRGGRKIQFALSSCEIRSIKLSPTFMNIARVNR